MINRSKKISEQEKFIYRMSMKKIGINKYKPITLLKKVVAYCLIGYGVVTCWFPSASQLALLGGCALLGIPFKVVWDKIKLYTGRAWFVVCVLCDRERFRYELRRILL